MTTIDDRVRELEARLDKMESAEAIRALRCRYHELVNEDRGDRLWELFAPDASVIYGGRAEVKGRDNIRTFFENFPVRHARQFIHNHVVEVDGDHATGYSYLDGRPVREGRSFVVVGRFDDRYVRLNGQWLISWSELTVHYMIGPGDGWADKIPLPASSGQGARP